ncbi:hypothetical protein KR50_13280 [Jeotgalibacillus campisalis]|uniref:Uncharacterized protein n=1 Tax=Jeotgalibacillus campisalis TaxID=220754 RepID=A0A0C2VIN0_9BACL|nr:hypothetical protein KR50_13280 [Jeotgalibacillus campisalis]
MRFQLTITPSVISLSIVYSAVKDRIKKETFVTPFPSNLRIA